MDHLALSLHTSSQISGHQCLTIFLDLQWGAQLVTIFFLGLSVLFCFKQPNPSTMASLLPILMPPSLGTQRVLAFLLFYHLMSWCWLCFSEALAVGARMARNISVSMGADWAQKIISTPLKCTGQVFYRLSDLGLCDFFFKLDPDFCFGEYHRDGESLFFHHVRRNMTFLVI